MVIVGWCYLTLCNPGSVGGVLCVVWLFYFILLYIFFCTGVVQTLLLLNGTTASSEEYKYFSSAV